MPRVHAAALLAANFGAALSDLRAIEAGTAHSSAAAMQYGGKSSRERTGQRKAVVARTMSSAERILIGGVEADTAAAASTDSPESLAAAHAAAAQADAQADAATESAELHEILSLLQVRVTQVKRAKTSLAFPGGTPAILEVGSSLHFIKRRHHIVYVCLLHQTQCHCSSVAVMLIRTLRLTAEACMQE